MKLQQIGRILVYGKPVDLRNGFDGLEGIVATELGENPTSGDLFVFTNRRGNLAKALLWDRTGYIIISKRLERGRFRLRVPGDKVELSPQNLELLLDGIPAGGLNRTQPRTGIRDDDNALSEKCCFQTRGTNN